MIPANFRNAFIETLQELTDLVSEDPSEDRIEWTAEYLSRSHTWYHFDGRHEGGKSVAWGQEFDTRTGAVNFLDPELLPLAMLDFNQNAAVAAYYGERCLSTQIASEFLRGFICVPEIVRISIEKESHLECGTLTRTSTVFVFVGFETMDDVDDVGSAKGLAASKDELSRHWYRGRVRMFAPREIVKIWNASPIS